MLYVELLDADGKARAASDIFRRQDAECVLLVIKWYLQGALWPLHDELVLLVRPVGHLLPRVGQRRERSHVRRQGGLWRSLFFLFSPPVDTRDARRTRKVDGPPAGAGAAAGKNSSPESSAGGGGGGGAAAALMRASSAAPAQSALRGSRVEKSSIGQLWQPGYD